MSKFDITEWRNFVGLLPEGLILAFVTLVGYGFAFVFRTVFLGYFGVPYQFVELGLTELLMGMVLVVFGLCFVVGCFFFLLVCLPKRRTLYLVYLQIFLLCLLSLDVVVFSESVGRLRLILAVLTPLIAMIIYFLVVPFIYHREKPGYFNRLVTRLKPSWMHSVITGILIFFFLDFALPSSIGFFIAKRQVMFLVTNASPEMVVLYKSSDNLICAPFDRKTKKVYKRFTILRLDKESVPVLSFQEVGPLIPD